MRVVGLVGTGSGARGGSGVKVGVVEIVGVVGVSGIQVGSRVGS